MSDSLPLITLQPVFDTRNAWAALLLESLSVPNAVDLARIFTEYRLTEALGPLPCIVSLPDLASVAETLPADQIILRLPVAYCCDRANDELLQAARTRGFRLMATGLPPTGQIPWEGVTALALPCAGEEAPVGTGSWLATLPGPHLALGAAKTTCPGRCHFQWLSGHVAGSTQPIPAKGAEAPNRTLLLDLLAKVAADVDSHKIEAVIKRDPQLSYHLLRLVNSVSFSLPTKISSFNQAIAILGRRQLQRWLQLLLYARNQKSDLANALLPRAAMRAGLAEALCAGSGGSHEAQDRAFMAGMFSQLDVLFGIPLAKIVKPLNLTDDVVSALIERSGSLGRLLLAVEAGEKAPDETLAALLPETGISHAAWARAVVHAAHWAIQISREA